MIGHGPVARRIETKFKSGPPAAPLAVQCPICEGIFGVGSHLEGVTFTQHLANHVAALVAGIKR
jgi:hypothetical protein